jgi:hypothetical protein
MSGDEKESMFFFTASTGSQRAAFAARFVGFRL